MEVPSFDPRGASPLLAAVLESFDSPSLLSQIQQQERDLASQFMQTQFVAPIGFGSTIHARNACVCFFPAVVFGCLRQGKRKRLMLGVWISVMLSIRQMYETASTQVAGFWHCSDQCPVALNSI